MRGFRLERADEYSHRPTAEPNFNESVYANGWDPRLRMGAWMRLGNRVNEGHAELSVCIYLPDGRVACQFRRPQIDSNERHAAGGMAYAVLEPFHAVEMSYRGELMVLDDAAQSGGAVSGCTARDGCRRVPSRRRVSAAWR